MNQAGCVYLGGLSRAQIWNDNEHLRSFRQTDADPQENFSFFDDTFVSSDSHIAPHFFSGCKQYTTPVTQPAPAPPSSLPLSRSQVDHIVVQPLPAADLHGRRAAGVDGVTLGLFVTLRAVVDGPPSVYFPYFVRPSLTCLLFLGASEINERNTLFTLSESGK